MLNTLGTPIDRTGMTLLSHFNEIIINVTANISTQLPPRIARIIFTMNILGVKSMLHLRKERVKAVRTAWLKHTGLELLYDWAIALTGMTPSGESAAFGSFSLKLKLSKTVVLNFL